MPTSSTPSLLNDGGLAVYQPFLASFVATFAQPAPEARRIFHGRGHCFPGLEHLNVDWYPPVLLLAFHDEPEHLDQLLPKLLAADVLQQLKSVIVQKRLRHRADSETVWGEQIPATVVEEDGLKFEVRPGRNRHAGLFLDTRPLRRWLHEHSQDANVLNLFAYTCSLSVAALAGGARQVVNVDMNKPSIQWGEANHRHNCQDLQRVVSLPHNLFSSWGRIRQSGRYDTVIIDPPTRQRGSFDVEKNYGAVIKRLPKLVAAGANVIATVNSPRIDSHFLVEQFNRYAPALEFVGNLPAASEFVEKHPERGLKIYHFRQPPQ
jgi:23S rRNA (cytosine1962-C5)-methyltransferase